MADYEKNIIPGVIVMTRDYRGRTFSDFYVGRETIGKGWYVYGRNSEYGGTLVALVAYPDAPPRKLPKISRLVHVGFSSKAEAQAVADTLNNMSDSKMKMVPLLNPIKPRKRAARKTKVIHRAGLPKTDYIKRPSQMTGTKPTKRLVARRAVAKRRGTFPNPGGTYYVQLVRASNDASGNPRKLAIVYDADGVRVDAVPYSYGTYEDDFKRLGYSHHIAMQYQIEITPKEFSWLKGARRINNPKKSNVVTFHAFNVITKGGGKIQVHDGASTQDAAARKAEKLGETCGEKVYVATRAWIKSHTGA